MNQGRATVTVRDGLVASSHELASFYGAKMLSEGGNVVDAALTTSAMLCVTQNNLCGIGGDLFALIKINGKVLYLNGSGRAAEKATIDFYRNEKKLTSIPHRGPLAAPTVPGIVHAWGELHSKFGSADLKKILAPAIHYARDGYPITRNYSLSIRASSNSLGEYSEWSKIFLPNGSSLEPGFLLRQRDLANSLEQIANEGTSTFYKGALADKIAKGVEKQGGLISGDDLKNHTSSWSTSVQTSYRGLKVYETAPNSQAATVLLWLNMLETYDLAKEYPLDSAKLVDVLVETCLKAYQERGKKITDPDFLPLDPKFLSKEFARDLLGSSLDTVLETPKIGRSSGDTTYFAVGNSNGDCLSVIQSNYMGFGSGLVPEGTGLVLHNRGCYFSLDEHHHNALRPRKRTFHTLCASMGETESGETRFAIGSMGGDIQPQVHVQLMTKVLDYGVDPQRAIDAPRWVLPFTIYEKPSSVYFEPGFEPLIPELKKSIGARGLGLEQFDTMSSQTGHAQMILFDKDSLAGAADPRGDGAAVGF
jgi:gamma-glutamyltranspeptidase